jgi:hypothetical protein
MISRITLFSLLLGLMLGAGLRLWSAAQQDACTPYLSGERPAQASEYVESGTRMIEVPCNDWFMRQPLRVQVLCLLDMALGVVFLLNALSDLQGWLQRRRRWRQTG